MKKQKKSGGAKKGKKSSVEKKTVGKKLVPLAAVMLAAVMLLTVAAAGWWYGVEAPKREAKRAADELAKAEARQEALMNTPVMLEIGSKPGGVKIRVDGVEVGTTGRDGLLRYKALPGNHSVVAQYESWPSQKSEVEVKEGVENKRVDFAFEAVDVELLSEPLGAEVRELVSGKVLGVTPLRKVGELRPGEMTWILSLAGYEEMEHRAMLKAGNNAAVRVVMKRLPKTAQELAAERLGAATKESPFVNSLGMEFVPVPGRPGVLMCRTETRVRDFRAYVEATGYVQSGGAYVFQVKKNDKGDYTTSVELEADAGWDKPGFEQGKDHPVVCVSWDEAQAFCLWLSRQNPEFSYRLPSDNEWSAAVGSIEKYPWGNEWPAPKGAGNYAGVDFNEATLGNWNTAYDHNDGAGRTARVGSYKLNRFGFYDLGGNVEEWCESWYREEMNDADVQENLKEQHDHAAEGRTYKVLRGASWSYVSENSFRSSYRNHKLLSRRSDDIGFRVVVNGSGYVNRDGGTEVDQMLRTYINIATALSQDELTSAKRHAALFLEDNGHRLLSSGFGSISRAESLKDLRKEFKILSIQVIGIAKGREGYYVMHCPMVKGGDGDWLQTSSEKAFNPYLGRKMLTCGGLKK